MTFPRDKQQTRAGGRYDHRHKQARAQAAKRHQPTDPCARCRQPLGPMSRHLHYDHHPSGIGYLGFAHAHCNSVAGAREGRRRQTQAVKALRRW